MNNRSFRVDDNSINSFIPSYSGTKGSIATHSNLSATTAYSILNNDKGNAFDAAAGAMLVESLVNPQMFGMGGEGVMILKPSFSKNPIVLNGNTRSPIDFNFLNLVTRGHREVPDQGILCAGVPSAFSSIIRLLQNYGNLEFRIIAKYALKYAKDGFPIHSGIVNQKKFGLKELEEKFLTDWKNSKNLYLKGNDIPKIGSLFKNKPFAELLDYLSNYEKKLIGNRKTNFNKLHDAFYKGDISDIIIKHSKNRDGLLKREDLSNFNISFEKTISEKFGDYEIHKTNIWGQGLTTLSMMKLSSKLKLTSLNNDEDIHKFIEILKLSFADREMYFTGQKNPKVKANHLLDDKYLSKRIKLISNKAIEDIIPGDPINNKFLLPIESDIKPWGAGTVHISIIDKDNNAISCTPSGGWIRSNEVIKDLGFPLGNRLMTFYLSKPGHVNFIMPEQQPRTTLSPTLVINKKEKELLSCGTMGGDAQDQWQTQFLINYIFAKKPIDISLNEPRVSSEHLPAYFHPHDPNHKQLLLEERLSPLIKNLKKKGHRAVSVTDWSEGFILCARKKGKIYDAYADIRSYKSQIFQAQAIAW